jgi:LemA protein
MYVLIGVLVLILLYFVFTYNKLVKLNNNVDEAFATMDVYLKKRWDLIPNIVETVKGYANHEKDTLEKIISLRNSVYDDLSQNDKLKTNKEVNQNISRLMALAESYPELKANENFLNLSKELTQIEDEIAQSRKYFNAVVRLFNNKVEMFPSNIVAKLISYKTKEMFVASETERASVKVDL